MWHYSDSLQINQTFYEFFSENADRDDASYWKTFIPHQTMILLLDDLIRALEGTSRKSVWIHGAYGTGKTHAQFVLKHMLEDAWPDVEAYLKAHALGQDLQRRLQTIKMHGQGVVVYRSSSASVTSNRKLMAEVQVAIKRALASKGYHDLVTPTLYDQILHRISGDDQVFDWARAFEKHRGQFLDFASAKAVVDRLQPTGPARDKIELMDRVAHVMDEEGFYVLDDAATVKAWIKEIIERVGLKWLVFIWDEFTDFFLNVNSLTGLQELAHLSTEAPFYLVLATHRSPELLQKMQGAQGTDWSKLRDRFSVRHYEMEPITAYHLMQKVLLCKSGEEERWTREQDDLWEQVRWSAKYLLSENDKLDDLRPLVPIHPYAAFLLSTISRQFSSSQRTMFRFLKRGDEGSFPVFLGEHPKDGWKWYVADNLWDYFFSGNAIELPPGFRDVVSYYRSREQAIQSDEERRAFKAVMLLLGLSREISNDPRLQPSLRSLRVVFAGTPIADRIEAVLDALSQRDLVHSIRLSTNDKQYTIPTGSVDREKIDEYKSEFKFPEEVQTSDPKSGTIGRLLQPLFTSIGDILNRRQSFSLVSAQEFDRRRQNVIPKGKFYQIPVVVVVASEEPERTKTLELARKLAVENPDVWFVVPETAFGASRWDDWCENRALARWYSGNKDPQNAKYYDDTATNRISEWLKTLRMGQIHTLLAEEQLNVAGTEGYGRTLEQLVDRRFPYRPELLCATSTLYRDHYGPKSAEVGLGISGVKASGSSSALNSVIHQLVQQGLWRYDPGFDMSIYERRPDNPLSRLQARVREFFADQDSVSLNGLWNELQAPPFGLMPSDMGIMIMGLLLRDYVDGYYWRDGINTRPLNPNKMADLIDDVMHGRQQATLSRTTREASEFCEIVRQVFDLPPEGTKYPEHARESLRGFLTNMGYPIWALRYAIDVPIPGLELLEDILRDTQDEGGALSTDRLAALVPSLEEAQVALKWLVERRSFEPGMSRFIKSSSPLLLSAAKELDLHLKDLMVQLRALMNEEVWLWRESEIRERLPELHAQLRVTTALNGLLGQKDTGFDSAVNSLRKSVQDNEMPLFVLREQEDEMLASTFDSLGLLLKDPRGYADKLPLAEALIDQRGKLQAALGDRVSALGRWISVNMDVTLAPEEITPILERLSIVHGMSPETLKGQVSGRLREMSKQKLLDELIVTWVEITGSASPDEWSTDHGVPIYWVLENQEYLSLCALMSTPTWRSEDEIRAALQFMNSRRHVLAGINQDGVADHAFLSVTLGPYGELVHLPQDIIDLREFLMGQLGSAVVTWERAQAARLGDAWIRRHYEQRLYAEVVHRMEQASEKELKELMKDLVKDPLVGAKLLQHTR